MTHTCPNVTYQYGNYPAAFSPQCIKINRLHILFYMSSNHAESLHAVKINHKDLEK